MNKRQRKKRDKTWRERSRKAVYSDISPETLSQIDETMRHLRITSPELWSKR